VDSQHRLLSALGTCVNVTWGTRDILRAMNGNFDFTAMDATNWFALLSCDESHVKSAALYVQHNRDNGASCAGGEPAMGISKGCKLLALLFPEEIKEVPRWNPTSAFKSCG